MILSNSALANLAYGTEQGAEQAARRLTSHSIGFATDRLPGPLSSFTQNLSEQVIINRRSLEEIDYAAATTDSLVSHGVNKGFVRVAGRGAPTNATLGVGNVLGNIAGNQAGNLIENFRVNDAISSLARDIRRRGTNFL